MRLSQKPFFAGLTFSVVSALFVTATAALGQDVNLIQTEVDSVIEESLWKWGPLRLAPQIRFGAGYDSNSLSSAVAPVNDFAATIAPGIRVAAPMRNRPSSTSIKN